MPNWCDNILTIDGPKDKMDDLFRAIGIVDNKLWDFDKLILTPPALLSQTCPIKDDEQKKRNIEMFGHEDWWYWRIANWGCKWPVEINEIDKTDLEGDKYSMRIAFDSPWSPPTGIMRFLFETFPEVDYTLYYFEPGCGFQGEMIWEAGELVKDESWDYDIYEEVDA